MAEPELQYATDEDTFGPDPLARRYDFSKDPLDYARNQMRIAKRNRDRILKDLVKGKAALTPLGGIGEETGGYKGYGYATVVEILSAALQDGKFLKGLSGYDKEGRKIPYSLGHFFMAINVDSFIELEKFKKIAGDILRNLRNSRKAPGNDRIFTAGEKEYLAWNERKDKGVPLGRELRLQFIQMRDELQLDVKFGFESI